MFGLHMGRMGGSGNGGAAAAAPFELTHIQWSGQSLSIGSNSGAVVDGLNPDARAYMFTTNAGVAPYGPRTHFDSAPSQWGNPLKSNSVTGLEPLKEALVGGSGETCCTGFAAQVLASRPAHYRLLQDCHGAGSMSYRSWGVNGNGLANNAKTRHFHNGQTLQELGKREADNLALAYRFAGLMVVHGERDALGDSTIAANRSTYLADLIDWQKSYAASSHTPIAADRAIPMFNSQLSNMKYGAGAFNIALAQLDATANPLIFLVGPKYWLGSGGYVDGTHLNSLGYRVLGEYFGKAYAQWLATGLWKPLYPISAARAGAVVDVAFNVPVGALTIDTTNVTAAANYGLAYSDSTTSATISSVAVLNATTLRVTLSATPTGTGQRITFAETQPDSSSTGPTTGARTNLRDQDATMGTKTGTTLYNWCCHAEVLFT